jgi:hypothetical protein
MYKNNLMQVIKYLKGEIDIYDGKHENVITTWNNAWDEMNWMGYNPQSINGIQKYINEQL